MSVPRTDPDLRKSHMGLIGSLLGVFGARYGFGFRFVRGLMIPEVHCIRARRQVRVLQS